MMCNSNRLAYEVERTLYEFSSTWEGIDAQEIPLDVGEVILRTEAGFAAAMPLRFHPQTVEASLDRAIEDLALPLPTTHGLIIEPLSWSNAEEYAIAFAGHTDSSYQQTLLAQASRFLQRSPREVQIDLARLDKNIAGYAVLRMESPISAMP